MCAVETVMINLREGKIKTLNGSKLRWSDLALKARSGLQRRDFKDEDGRRGRTIGRFLLLASRSVWKLFDLLYWFFNFPCVE